MDIIGISCIILAAIVSCLFVIGYFFGYKRGYEKGTDDGFAYGHYVYHYKHLMMMDRNGMFKEYCQVLADEARRQGMEESEVEKLIKEQKLALEEIKEIESEVVAL